MKPQALHASVPLDFSKTGIVHLPPLPSSGSERSSSTRPTMSSRQASRFSSSDQSGSDMSRAAIQSPAPPGNSAGNSGTDSESDGQMIQRSTGPTSSGSSSADELVTYRFKSVTNDHGNHVITGREGKLARCEDEVSAVNNETPLQL